MGKETQLIERQETIKEAIMKQQTSIKDILPEHVNIDRFLRSALLVIYRDYKLQKCSKESLISSIIDAAELGLDFTKAKGHAYLVPFWNSEKNCFEAAFMPGYRGLIHLAVNSGMVKTADAQLVCEKDVFEYSFENNIKHFTHTVDWFGERGKVIGAYAIVYFGDGDFQVEPMSITELSRIKNMTKSKDKKGNVVGPWKDFEHEMFKKTPIRRISKKLPCSPDKDEKFFKALEHDDKTSGIDIINGDMQIDDGRTKTEKLEDILTHANREEPPEESEESSAPETTYVITPATSEVDNKKQEKGKGQKLPETSDDLTSQLGF